jgi:cell division protein FtsA
VVLTGGGALMKEIGEKAGEIFNADIKTGQPMHITGLEERLSGPEYATITGLLLYGNEYQERYGSLKRPQGFGQFFGDLSGSVKNFFREMF